MLCTEVDWVGQDARSGLFVGVNRTDCGHSSFKKPEVWPVDATCQRKLFVAMSAFDLSLGWDHISYHINYLRQLDRLWTLSLTVAAASGSQKSGPVQPVSKKTICVHIYIWFGLFWLRSYLRKSATTEAFSFEYLSVPAFHPAVWHRRRWLRWAATNITRQAPTLASSTFFPLTWDLYDAYLYFVCFCHSGLNVYKKAYIAIPKLLPTITDTNEALLSRL